MKLSFWTKIALSGALFFQLGAALAAVSEAQLRDSGARVVANSQTGVVRFVGFDAPLAVRQQIDAARLQMPAQMAATQHLSDYAELFGLRDVSSETTVIKHRDAKDGRSVTRYQQNFQGIPVIGGELIVNQTAQRQLSSINGRVSPQLQIATTPVITSQQAMAIAREAMVKWYSIAADEFLVPVPTLSIYDSRLISPLAAPVALVWRLDVTTKGDLPIREFVAVNAVNGAITLHFNQVPHAKNRLTYDANNTAADPGTLVCNESNPTCSGGVADAVYAHRFAGATYDFYSATLGRDSIDGLGMTLVSLVRICPVGESCPYQNAYWNGVKMSYGAGFATGEDVVAHELTHGVTEKESNLFYYYQAGAINESLSDVFGELVQQNDPTGTVVPATKWLMGEDLSIGALRSMSNPTLYGDPDRMTSANYYTGSLDQGGVHTNSGVNNKAAYLMVDGGTFNGQTVSAIGLVKTAQIYYRAQTSLLTSGSDYLDLHHALYQACQDLIGSAGIGAADCLAVQRATLAVEMNASPSAGFMPAAVLCPAGQSVSSTLFADGFEGGTSNWLFTHAAGTDDWSRTTGYASTGIYSLYGFDPTTSSDLRAAMASSVTLPANAHLWFNHAFGFEKGTTKFYDGGVLEYSSNGGASWIDAGSLYTEGQNYGGVLAVGNPLQGRSAFVGASHGYVSSRYNLATLAGQNVRFRWRVGTDSGANLLGWIVDDVKIHVCAADVNPDTPRLSNISTRGQVQTGDSVMIGGFIIDGATAKKVLIRARGPSLSAYGVPGVLANPKVDLYSGPTVIASNDNWGSATNAADITATGLAPTNSLESAILTTLSPGAYTAIVSGVGNTSGVGIVEVLEMDNPAAPLINISTRGQVQTGDNVMIGGFIIDGANPQTVLIRARGPSLSDYGVPGVLADPTMEVYSGQSVIASNDNWGTATNAADITATGLAPTNAMESAILTTLDPGAYTVIVRGFNNTTGVGIVEVLAQ
ncbi:M4 family metallopeptidase [Rhodoferax sp.]|uniref:M4 family metallopeptidase n=1 Tax=Rhodoferax sp. TaxID=50421 RepID=UPI002637A89C|nr:M4 family metallopeptidase [Rhodoferax sp.]MDD2919822.1 M4 family metallopeptidase [Rhodoferax sp.]